MIIVLGGNGNSMRKKSRKPKLLEKVCLIFALKSTFKMAIARIFALVLLINLVLLVRKGSVNSYEMNVLS